MNNTQRLADRLAAMKVERDALATAITIHKTNTDDDGATRNDCLLYAALRDVEQATKGPGEGAPKVC